MATFAVLNTTKCFKLKFTYFCIYFDSQYEWYFALKMCLGYVNYKNLFSIIIKLILKKAAITSDHALENLSVHLCTVLYPICSVFLSLLLLDPCLHY